MKEIRYFYCPDISVSNELPKEEFEHAVKVLRLQPSDTCVLTDGKGNIYDVAISSVTKKSCTFSIISQRQLLPTWQGKIHIGVAPTKNISRIEWLVEKATEIGFDSIHFLDCQFSERKNINIERLDKVAVAAMKQSHKSVKPELTSFIDFNDFIRKPFDGNKYIAHCYDEKDIGNASEKQYLPYCLQSSECKDSMVLIGPEGDFSIQEVRMALDYGYQPVTLGPSRLRTETAALLAVTMMNMNNVII